MEHSTSNEGGDFRHMTLSCGACALLTQHLQPSTQRKLAAGDREGSPQDSSSGHDDHNCSGRGRGVTTVSALHAAAERGLGA